MEEVVWGGVEVVESGKKSFGKKTINEKNLLKNN